MPTTTNYGWTTPADTDLVKDGASAIRTLGTAIDTTTKNLNPSTTLGDIEYRSSTANTNTRLGIGSSGDVLTVAGGVPSWAAPASGGMTLISTTTLSGATTTLSSIPQTYNDLLVVVGRVTGNTANGDVRLMPNNVTNLIDLSAVRNTTATGLIDNRLILSIFEQTDRTNANNVWSIRFIDYKSSTQFKTFNMSGSWISAAGTQQRINGGGAFRSNTAISSLVFDYDGTNTFAGGTVLLYGVK